MAQDDNAEEDSLLLSDAADETADEFVEEEIGSIFAQPEVAEVEEGISEESSLSAEDEADLMAELAAAEADAADDEAPEADAQTAEVAEEPASDATTEEAKPSFEDSDAAMARLMEETDAKLEEPENRSRREAYSHLKAAVAAKFASRSMGEEEGATPEKLEGDYRADLAQVVRPRRAARAEGTEPTKRPDPAPLKLVASQRVDTAKAEGEALDPVRPRRVAATELDDAVASSSAFAEFAAQSGADALPDVLEAAASYLTLVEGENVFSRPQMMRAVRQAMPQGSFTREDGLRAFGTLLRQGRIRKLRGGQFEITEKTGYQPEAREMRAAG